MSAKTLYSQENGKVTWAKSGKTCRGVDPNRYHVKTYYDTWTGKVALLSPSDYAFATGGKKRSDCLKNIDTRDACNNYLTSKNDNHQWFLNAYSGCLNKSSIGFGSNDGSVVGLAITSNAYEVRPTLYLDADTSYTGGDGSETNPYILKIK